MTPSHAIIVRRHAQGGLARAPLLLCCAVGLSCTSTELQLAAPKVDITGTYCPSTSNILDVPLRIMLIIDTSGSMENNDPTDGRMRAAEQLITTFSPESDVRFSIVTFDDYATSATVDEVGDGVFTRDPNILAGALSQLQREDGFTNYLSALGEATTIIRNDLIRTAQEIDQAAQNGEATDAMRPYYFVVFLSDGIPKVRGNQTQDDDTILFQVRELLDVPEPALGAVLHTAFLGAEEEDEARVLQAQATLGGMAEQGGGDFSNFANGEDIDFTLFEFQMVRLFDARRFLAYNRHAVVTLVGVQADTDGDGLADGRELELGADPLVKDSDGDNLGDGLEVLSGQRPARSDPYCRTKDIADGDNDGLTDCEELFRNLDPERFDTDLDLFPDWVELFSGSNPADGSDFRADMDFDGRMNEEELVQRTHLRHAEDEDRYQSYAYTVDHRRREQWSRTGLLERVCYDFNVDNVSIVETLNGGHNDVTLEFIESPLDDPQREFTLRRHVVEVRRDELRPGPDGGPSQLRLGEVEFETISVQKLDLFDGDE